MKMKALIVDDERIAREGIRRRIEKLPDFDVAGECANGLEALAFIQNNEIDLVFLDVQMPGLDGFGVIEKIGVEQMPPVIFVTAYDRYALKAFEVHAFDYLLKPFDEERFNRALEGVKRRLQKGKTNNHHLTELIEDLREGQKNLVKNLKTDSNYLERIVVKNSGRIFFVDVEEINWFEAADNYVKLHAGNETHLVREKIGNLETRLDPNNFLRIHRSIIVNTKQIKELQPMFDGVFVVVLKDGTELTSGRRFRKNFDALLYND